MTPLRGLDDIDWDGLQHAYGSAGDVPGLLRGIEDGPDPAEALDDLDVKIYHQGGIVFPAAVAALPFLVALAGSRDVAVRPGLLELVGRIADEAGRVPKPTPGWADAWTAVLPDVLALLGDPDAAVRREVASALAPARDDADTIVPVLRERWAAEEDGAARVTIVLAVGDLARGCTAATLPETLVWLCDLRGHGDAQIRLAAETALPKAVPAQRPSLDVLVDAIGGDGIDVWQHVPWVGPSHPVLAEFFGGGAARLLDWVDDRLGNDPATRTGLCLAFLRDRDPDRRIGAVRNAADLLSERRSPERVLFPGLMELSADPAPAARAYATSLLASLDAPDEATDSEAAIADRLAARLDDEARLSRHGDERIADIAVWGLARRRDPRCLPRILRRLDGASDMTDAHFTDPYTTDPPTLGYVLAPLAAYADELLPAIRSRLDDPAAAKGLAQALFEWGPAAAPAVPELVRLLGTDATVQVADVLAAIGPAASDAATALSSHRAHHDERRARISRFAVSLAFWKVTGDPGPALAAAAKPIPTDLAAPPMFRYRTDLGWIRHVAELGPLAAAHADRLHPLLHVREEWTRIEAAHAHYRITGDAETSAWVLSAEAYKLATSEARPVQWTAMKYLAAMDPVPKIRREALHEILDSDTRYHYFAGWRGFAEDRELRALAASLLRRQPK
ncbi:hypothetical protein [Actinomadura fibrosa]|uniref:HEAT repeat domain-containing protein n=1 Tax=Actinomadura fibrosa TaxID=111802 RepID=A0ABW2XKK5_9ACTN|nr:hypothetical protein [Actinomadura fibrosa]